jgi:signal transduction histidine kinase
MGTSTRVLIVAFVAVIAASIGSTRFVQHESREIDVDAAQIARDTAPGIQVVSNLRAEMRLLQALVGRTVDTGAGADDVSASRRRIDELLEQAVTLPTDPEEAVLLGKLHSSVRAFDEATERALEQARSGHRETALNTLRTSVASVADTAGGVANDLVQYDVRASEAAARRIEVARSRSNRIAWQLDALCALIAALAATLTVRAVRQVHRVQQEHHDLAQRKAEELEQFASRVAHDVLSPLSAVSMALAVVDKNPAHAGEALERAHASLMRVRRIVDGLLEFARAGARPELGARAEVRAVTMGIVEELRPFAAQRHATLRCEDVPECAVACSPGVLLSLLGNLLRNALKYLGSAEVREVTLHVRARRGRVLFEVEDTGPGIPESLGDRIFEPYIRGPNTSAPGIGLGLATVKRLVLAHGGTLGVRAGQGGGAIFWFELDEATPAEPEVRTPHVRSVDRDEAASSEAKVRRFP